MTNGLAVEVLAALGQLLHVGAFGEPRGAASLHAVQDMRVVLVLLHRVVASLPSLPAGSAAVRLVNRRHDRELTCSAVARTVAGAQGVDSDGLLEVLPLLKRAISLLVYVLRGLGQERLVRHAVLSSSKRLLVPRHQRPILVVIAYRAAGAGQLRLASGILDLLTILLESALLLEVCWRRLLLPALLHRTDPHEVVLVLVRHEHFLVLRQRWMLPGRTASQDDLLVRCRRWILEKQSVLLLLLNHQRVIRRNLPRYLLQRVLVHLLRKGHFRRVCSRMARIYASSDQLLHPMGRVHRLLPGDMRGVILRPPAVQVSDHLSFGRHWVSPCLTTCVALCSLLRSLLFLELSLALTQHFLLDQMVVTAVCLSARVASLDLWFLFLLGLRLFLFLDWQGALQRRHLTLGKSLVSLQVAARALPTQLDLALSLLSLFLLSALFVLLELGLERSVDGWQLLDELLSLHVILRWRAVAAT